MQEIKSETHITKVGPLSVQLRERVTSVTRRRTWGANKIRLKGASMHNIARLRVRVTHAETSEAENSALKTPGVSIYRLAVSGWAFTGEASRRCGRIRPNPTRKIPYAANTPNAIDPTVAQINISKLNKSAIILDSNQSTEFIALLR